MNNGRFAISLHILTLLDKANGELISSDFIAGSANVNPAIIRKEISNLKKHGLVDSKEGKTGGFLLAKSASKILLSDIYKAIRQVSLLGQTKNTPNPKCPVGRQINKHLDDLYLDTENALIKKLSKTTLAAFSNRFH